MLLKKVAVIDLVSPCKIVQAKKIEGLYGFILTYTVCDDCLN